MTDHALIDRFRQARRDTSLAVMDGLHAVKHGLRFGAETLEIVSPDVDAALNLAAEVAPDIRPRLAAELAQVSEDDFRQLSPVPPDTGVIAIARRPPVSAADVLCGPADAPVVLLEKRRFRGGRAFLIDMEGRPVHEWKLQGLGGVNRCAS